MTHPYIKNMDDKAGAARAKHLVKGYAKGGKVTVNVVVPGGGKESAPPMPPPILPPPPGPPPMAGPPSGGMPPPGLMPPGMKAGGRVSMKGGAESGVGRLDKKRAYGKRARGG